MNFDKGIESGLQRGYRKNGSLYANYEARNGRIYGLKKSKLCYSLENEKVQQTLQYTRGNLPRYKNGLLRDFGKSVV